MTTKISPVQFSMTVQIKTFVLDHLKRHFEFLLYNIFLACRPVSTSAVVVDQNLQLHLIILTVRTKATELIVLFSLRRRRRSRMMTNHTLSSIPNSFLSSLNKSFFARSAKNAERAALKVAFTFVAFLQCFELLMVRYVFLPLLSGFPSGPRSASAPAGRGTIL